MATTELRAPNWENCSAPRRPRGEREIRSGHRGPSDANLDDALWATVYGTGWLGAPGRGAGVRSCAATPPLA